MSTQDAKIQVGIGATVTIGSDRYPATVTRVGKGGDWGEIQKDTVVHGPGPDTFVPNPDGQRYRIRLVEGRWRTVGRVHWWVTIGNRQFYHSREF